MIRNGFVTEPRAGDLTTGRRGYLGGTDLAAILGVSERKTRFRVWAEKRDALGPETDFGEEAEAGIFLEPLILKRFARQFQLMLDATPHTYRLRDADFIGANPDALVLDAADLSAVAIVEAKTRGPFQRGLWGAPGSSDVPADELCQVQLYMHVLDLPVAYLPVLFDRRMEVFVVWRDRELGALMVEEATAFWNDYVVTGVAPPFEGPAAADYLRRKFPRVTDPMKDAEPEDDILVARRLLIRQHMAVLKTRLDAVEGALKARIGGAPAIVGTGYEARWGEVKARTTVDWHSVVTELRSFPLLADEEAARTVRAAIDASIDRHRRVGEPTRALKVYFKGPRTLPSVTLEPINALPAAPTEEGE